MIEGFSELNHGLIDLEELKSLSNVETLDDLSMQIQSVNNFAPEGISFVSVYEQNAYGKNSFQPGEILYQLSVSDADGDNILLTILNENDELDVDGDNLLPFGVNDHHQLIAIDVSDLEILLADQSPVNLEFELNDNNGRTNTMQGVLSMVNDPNTGNYAFLNAVLNRETSWYSSDWFGKFYPGNRGWLFHATLGWLFLQPSGENDFGFGMPITNPGGGPRGIKMFFHTSTFTEMEQIIQVGESSKILIQMLEYLNILINPR